MLTKAINPGFTGAGEREKEKKISIAKRFSAFPNHFKQLLLRIFDSQVQKLYHSLHCLAMYVWLFLYCFPRSYWQHADSGEYTTPHTDTLGAHVREHIFHVALSEFTAQYTENKQQSAAQHQGPQDPSLREMS